MALPDSEIDSTGRLDRFLFTPVNPRIAALFRVCLAVMIGFAFWPRGVRLAVPWSQVPGLSAFYQQVFLRRRYWWFTLGVLALYGAGWFPRILGFSLVVLLLPLSLVRPGPQSRQVLLFSLLSFSFLRSDASLIRRENREDSPGPMWPVRLIQLQLSVIYGVNALAKSTSEYLSGKALVEMSRELPNFLVDLSDGYFHLGRIGIPVYLAAVASVAVEYFLALGFWSRRLRIITAVTGVLFHLVLMQIVQIFILDMVSMFLYLAFLLPFARPIESGQVGAQPGGAASRLRRFLARLFG